MVRGTRQPTAIQISVPLDVALIDKEYLISGSALVVDLLTGSLFAKVNSPNGDLVDLGNTSQIRGPFVSIYLTCAAQPGLKARLLIVQDGFELEHQAAINVIGAYLAPASITGGTTSAIWTPASGKRVHLKRLSFSVDTATLITLLWNASAFESFYLPANGSIIVNLIDANEIGAADAVLTIKSSVTSNVTARATGKEE
jgi:hypothetical protein